MIEVIQGCGLNNIFKRPLRRQVGVSTAAHINALSSTEHNG